MDAYIIDLQVMKKRIVLSNAAINLGNKGCVALSYCSMYLIDKILGQGNYELYLTDSYQQSGHHILKIADKEIHYKSINLIRYYSIRGLLSGLFHIKSTLKTFYLLSKADCVLDIGYGDSFSDIYGKRRFKSIDRIHLFSRLLRRSYAFLPQTIGPFSNEVIRLKAVKSLENAKLIMTRDKQSFDYTKEIIGKNVNLHEYIDVAFLLPYKRQLFNEEYIHVGINVSALLWHGGYTGKNQFGLKCDYKRSIKSIIDFFLSLPKVKVHLIPHVVKTTIKEEDDYVVSKSLCEDYKADGLVLAPLFSTPVEAKNYISGLDFFVGARMHATIAAFSSGVPVVPMAYSRKFNGLFAETLHYDSIVDMKEMDEIDIVDAIKKAFNDRTNLRTLIDEQMKGVVKERKEKMIGDLSNFLMA